LAILYLAVMQSLAYATKHILEALTVAGRSDFSSILLCGGLSKNDLFVQIHADVCAIPVYLPEESEAVLLGAAMLGAYAARVYSDLQVRTFEFSENYQLHLFIPPLFSQPQLQWAGKPR
jgi:ribulose kinase